MSSLVETIGDATKVAMKARDKQRVAALRLVNAEIKRFEVDKRQTPTDDDVLDLLNRMVKQRNDSLKAYVEAKREDLAEQERYELGVLEEFMPTKLGADEIAAMVQDAITKTGAEGMKDMGKVMGLLTEPLKGRADMGAVSAQVKALLG